MCEKCEQIKQTVDELWVNYCPDWEYEKQRLEAEKKVLRQRYAEIESTPEFLALEREGSAISKAIRDNRARLKVIEQEKALIRKNPELKVIAQQISLIDRNINSNSQSKIEGTISFGDNGGIEYTVRQEYIDQVAAFKEQVLETVYSWADETLDKAQHFHGAWEFIQEHIQNEYVKPVGWRDEMDNFKRQVESLIDLMKKL